MSCVNISDWNAIKEFSDGVVEVKDSLKLISERYTTASPSLFSHFHAMLIYKDTFTNHQQFSASWVASGQQFFCVEEIPNEIIKSVKNIKTDPRLASSGVMLVDTTQNILFGFLFTNQSLYIVSGRHPIPPFRSFDEWKAECKYDQYIRMSGYGSWIEGGKVMSWPEFYAQYKLNDLSIEYDSWKAIGAEPWYWSAWTIFCSENESHLAMAEVYSREKISERTTLKIVVDPDGKIEWFVGTTSVFSQPRAGTRLLDKYRVLDTDEINLAATKLHLTPVLGTFSWMDAFLPQALDLKNICPLVKMAKKYVSPVADKLGNRHKMSRKDFVTDDYKCQLLGQGSALTVFSYNFANTDVLICEQGLNTGIIPIYTDIEPPLVKVDLRELACTIDYLPGYDSDED